MRRFVVAAGFVLLSLAMTFAQGQGSRQEKSFEDCSMNGRLKFKDGAGGRLQNHPAFFDPIQSLYNSNYCELSVSANPAQCPADYGFVIVPSFSGIGRRENDCEAGLARVIGKSLPGQCGCQRVDSIAQSMTRQEFYDFEKAYAARLKAGWTAADLSNPMSVAQGPVAPDVAAGDARRQSVAPAKAEDERRQTEVLAKAEEDRRQQEALARSEEARRQQETPPQGVRCCDIQRWK